MRAFKLSCIICVSILISDSIFGQSVRFRNDIYDEALATAQREDKLIFIDTWAEWCGPCKKMEPVFRDPEVASYMNQNFVNIRIDMGREGEIKQKVRMKYDVFFLPTLLIVDKFGEVMFRADNKILSAKELVNIAKAVNTPQDYILSQAPPQSASDPSLIDASKTVEKIVITDNMMLTKSSESGSTVLVPRPNISDPNYSDDPNEKVLHTLGQGDELPPEILYEEAYFRYTQLSDGTYRETVNKYLSSQTDLSTVKNVKFIFDFLMNTDTEQFEYLINNRSLFEDIIGAEEVKKSIGILVFQKMYQAIDRPDLSEAKRLLSLVDPETSEIIANQYILNRLFDENNIEFISKSIQYLKKINPRDIQMAKKLGLVINSDPSIQAKELSDATKCISKITDQLADYELQHLHAALLHKKGKSSQAKDMAQKAIQSAKNQGIDFSKTTALMTTIE